MANNGKQIGNRKGRKITPEIERFALERAAKGVTTRAIAAQVAKDFGVEITHVAFAKLLKHTRVTRADVAKTVVREALSAALLPDLDVLQEELGRLRRLSEKTFNVAIGAVEGFADITPKAIDSCTDAYLQTVDRINKIVHTRLHFSGADEPDAAKSGGAMAPFIVIPPESDD